MIKIKTALLSVFNKEGILELAKELAKHNVEILSSGGTAKYLCTGRQWYRQGKEKDDDGKDHQQQFPRRMREHPA